MGKRGPQKTPTNILSLRGSWRAGEREGEPVLSVEDVEPPEWLSDDAKGHFVQHVAILKGMGVMNRAFAVTLALYCESYAMLIEMKHAMCESGRRNRQMAKEFHEHADRLVKWGREFGLSPSAIASVKKLDTGKQPSGLDRFKQKSG